MEKEEKEPVVCVSEMGLFNQLLYLVPELFSPPVLLSQYWKFSTAHSRKAVTE
jgi:hypothetical protein